MNAVLRKAAVAAALATTTAVAATPADAALVTSVQVRNNIGTWLQIAELQLFAGGVNVAQGKTATATSVYDAASAPGNAVDGSTNGVYPAIYHGGSSSGSDVLTVNLGGTFDVTQITIFGRTDCCSDRDSYSYQLFNGSNVVASGTLDSRNRTSVSASIAAVPEPATWAMLLVGFAMVGATARYRRRQTAVRYA